jgi:hypothetical protein
LLVRFLSASSAVAVFGFFLLWKGRLKTSPRFSSSLVFSQEKKQCNGLVWANRLLPGGGVIFCFRVLPLQQSGISLSLSLSLSLVMQKAKEMRPWLLVMVHLSPWQ